jgi:DNA polymerase-1
VGDTSDNIPGVPGIGKKTATDLVQQFDSLEDLYARLDEVKKAGTKKALEENKDKAFLSRDLFLLQYYAYNRSADDLAFDASRWKYARPLFEELNFKSLIAELGTAVQDAARSFEQKVQYLRDTYQLITVTTPEQLTALAHELKTSSGFAVDTEGDSLNPLLSDLVGISLCTKPGVAYYVPLTHTTSSAQLPRELIDEAFKPIFENEHIPKYLHHTKFDQLMFSSNGMELRGVTFDTLIAANLVTRDWQRINLKELSSTYLEEEMLTFQEVVKQFKLPNFAHTELDIATLYSAFDAHQTLRLMPLFQKMLETEGMEDLFTKIEMPLSQVLYRMEKEGILLDVGLIKQLNVHITSELETILAKLEPFMGEHTGPINLNSPKQVGELLFEKLKLPPKKKSSKGAYSTDQEVLTELAKIHPVPGMIITYRELFKLKSTYLDALPTYVNPHDGKIHTSYSQTSVATGRLASSDPNLQNIPASGYGLEIRTAFKPQAGHVFIAADYSQIELRVLAHLSQDRNLLNAFLHGHDIHAETAARLFDTPLDQVTHEQRQIGKRINFSILYGLTPYGLSQDLDISFKDAKLYIDKYFAQYPAVSRWMDEVIEQTKEKGYVQTFWGRRRYIPAIYEKNRALYEEARRVAINTVAQGTAAEIMKLGMIAVDKHFTQNHPQARILLQIHDELLVSAPHEVSSEIESLVKDTLESVVSWSVPLVASTRIGANWKDVSK